MGGRGPVSRAEGQTFSGVFRFVVRGRGFLLYPSGAGQKMDSPQMVQMETNEGDTSGEVGRVKGTETRDFGKPWSQLNRDKQVTRAP